MTDTINNVSRDDLDLIRVVLEGFKPCIARDDALRTVRAILSAPSPAGVDGLKRYEVFPYLDDDVAELDICESDDGSFVKYDAAQAIIDGLRGEAGAQRVKTCTALKERNDAREERDAALVECERRQMQLAACGVVALANTIESAGEARQMHPDYMSASCSDVADAVDREIALRTERDTLRQQLAVRDEEIERSRVQLMTIASAEPARHSIEWAKAVAATGNNEVYAKWREAFDERDQQARRIGELEGLLLRVQVSLSLDDTEWGYSGAEKYKLLSDIRAALSSGKKGE